jgi:hypothetical protein
MRSGSREKLLQTSTEHGKFHTEWRLLSYPPADVRQPQQLPAAAAAVAASPAVAALEAGTAPRGALVIPAAVH